MDYESTALTAELRALKTIITDDSARQRLPWRRGSHVSAIPCKVKHAGVEAEVSRPPRAFSYSSDRFKPPACSGLSRQTTNYRNTVSLNSTDSTKRSQTPWMISSMPLASKPPDL